MEQVCGCWPARSAREVLYNLWSWGFGRGREMDGNVTVWVGQRGWGGGVSNWVGLPFWGLSDWKGLQRVGWGKKTTKCLPWVFEKAGWESLGKWLYLQPGSYRIWGTTMAEACVLAPARGDMLCENHQIRDTFLLQKSQVSVLDKSECLSQLVFPEFLTCRNCNSNATKLSVNLSNINRCSY